jgi:hypothetical protein
MDILLKNVIFKTAILGAFTASKSDGVISLE